jgi:shikimate kinase
VWLCAALETIAARMEKDTAGGAERPSLTDETSVSEMNVILAKREPLYRRLADLIVDTTRIETDRVVEAILKGLREQISRADEIIKGKEK